MQVPPRPLANAFRQLRSDLRTDPYLVYVLGLALVLCSFWFWHGLPNFATWDERDRLLDPLVAYSSVLEDPSIESLRQGVAWGREPFGATFYVYALALLPVVLAAAITGDLSAIEAIHFPSSEYGYYPVWQATPKWIWTWSLAFARLTNVVFAVASVYCTYRIGVDLRDRATGRLAAVLLTLTFGFVKLAHEGGEDMPAVFFLLLALTLLIRYVETGRRDLFLWASAAGGVALAFKLTAAPIVLVVGLAVLLRARAESTPLRRALWRPRLLLSGAGVGAVALAVGFPTLLVGHVEPVVGRLFGHTSQRTGLAVGPTAPTWWWFLRTYVSGLGIPLLLAGIAGVLASALHLRTLRASDDRGSTRAFSGTALLLGCLGLYLLLYATWHDFRVHHLLPTFPLVALLTAGALERFRDRRPSVAAPVLAALLLTTALYAGAGTAGYATLPRDEARTWLNEHADRSDTMEGYFHGFQEIAVPHWMALNPIWADPNETDVERCPDYIQLTYKDLLYLRDVPDDQRGYDVDSNVDARARYVRALLDGEYNYEVAAEFGPRPPNYVPQRPTPGSLADLVALGINPHSDQYGDEQELTVNQYTLIMEHEGPCDESRTPPW
ncbi:ArnT family glycosyltransferase [Halorientalis salina]|uniref:ArnT family glycosyltransferase n=1 Tax=Halorientalis salina TaxID=2932266 RepID=UPI0010ABF76E|nr:glycosyltransferase family 39 protein [Halorientalis salina]